MTVKYFVVIFDLHPHGLQFKETFEVIKTFLKAQ